MEIISRDIMKKCDDNESVLYYRNESDIRRLVHYILDTSKPSYIGCSGFVSDLKTDSLVKEILQIQQFYKKESGVRIRYEYVIVQKNELTKGIEIQQITQYAVMFSKYLYARGFQNLWGIVDQVGSFSISFAVNTVSPFDGCKFHFNKNDFMKDAHAYLRCVIDAIDRKTACDYDMRMLEFYPYSFNLTDIM